MPDREKRWPDVPPTARAYVEQLSEVQIERLLALEELYRRLSPEAIEFLERTQPETLRWLSNARPDEIKQLDEGIKLVRSTMTVGKFMKWALISLVGTFVGIAALGDWISRALQWVRGH